MPESNTVIPLADGQNVDASEYPNGNVRERDRGNPPTNPQNPSFLQDPLNESTSITFYCDVVSNGLVGYLELALLSSSGLCIWTIFNGSTVIGTLVTNASNVEFYPPDKSYEQCVAGQRFSITVQNADDHALVVAAKVWWDEF